MNTLIKLYGERNTNTNYLSKLIELNLDTIQLPGVVPPIIRRLQKVLPGREIVQNIYFHLSYGRNLGWKHAKVKSVDTIRRCSVMRNNNVVFITITKNPYSWALSFYRDPYYHDHPFKKPDFETFLQTPWQTSHRDNTKPWLSSPIGLWNIKNASYLQLFRLGVLNLTTESTFVDPEAVIERIHKTYSITKLSDKFLNYEQSTKDESKDTNYYRDYYLNEKWRDELSVHAISIINERIDKTLMSRFGYDVLL